MERIEILSGVVRRRRWSSADKERIVGETLQPGVTITEVARRHEVERSVLYRWRREFGVIRVREPAGFLPVEVSAAAAAAETSGRDAAAGLCRAGAAPAAPAGMIEIALVDGVRLRVDRSVDAAALSRVLRALGRR